MLLRKKLNIKITVTVHIKHKESLLEHICLFLKSITPACSYSKLAFIIIHLILIGTRYLYNFVKNEF